MERLSNDHQDYLNQHDNSHKLCNETRYSVLSLLESKWKLRQPHDQSFQLQGKPLQNKYWRQKK